MRSKGFVSEYSIGATSNSLLTRLEKNDFENYLNGQGIDIGCGNDPLKIPKGHVATWDKKNGDATFLMGIEDKKFDFVYSSHCLEHVCDIQTALINWTRILKTGGFLFVVVPDYELYEQKNWPSRYNFDHKHSFSTTIKRSDLQRDNHFHIEIDLKPFLESININLLEIRVEDDRYDYDIKNVDQTGPYHNALAQICFIGQRK